MRRIQKGIRTTDKLRDLRMPSMGDCPHKFFTDLLVWDIYRPATHIVGQISKMDEKVQGLCKVPARSMQGWHDRINHVREPAGCFLPEKAAEIFFSIPTKL